MARGAGRALGAAIAIALVLAGCAGDEGATDPAGGGPSDDGPASSAADSADAVAWTHLGVVESTLPGEAAAEVVTDADALTAAWTRHGFEAAPPDVAFDDEVVLLLGRPDDACPDELIRLEVAGGRLQTEWLPPPGGCEQPLILWLHAVQVHRGVLTESFTYGPDAPFESELAGVTLELPPYAGAAPRAPEPPRAMDDAALDEVFAGHPVQRCGPDHDVVGRDRDVDGPLSDDPEVAAAQQGRAQHGVPSDEASTREAMERPDRLDEYGFPLLPEEQDADMRASELITWAMEALEADGWDVSGRMPGEAAERGMVVPMIDRSAGIAAAVVVGPDDEDAVRRLLDRELGAGAIEVVVDTRWPPTIVAEAQQAVTELMSGDGGAGSISWVSGPPGPVEIGMIDPTREALDAIASVVDAALVCVSVELSGVRPAG